MITNPEKSEKRCVLSADIYAFACIAWKLLHASVDPARALEDPFDFELKKLKIKVPNCSELSESQRLKLLFEDRSLRPSLSFARPEHDKIADLISERLFNRFHVANLRLQMTVGWNSLRLD